MMRSCLFLIVSEMLKICFYVIFRALLCIRFIFLLRIHWKLLMILKTSTKLYKVMLFWHVKVYISSENWLNTLCTEIKEKRYKNSPMTKSTLEKSALFSLRELQLISFIFNLQFLYEMKHKLRPSTNVCEIFHFVFIKVYIFVQQKAWTLWL